MTECKCWNLDEWLLVYSNYSRCSVTAFDFPTVECPFRPSTTFQTLQRLMLETLETSWWIVPLQSYELSSTGDETRGDIALKKHLTCQELMSDCDCDVALQSSTRNEYILRFPYVYISFVASLLSTPFGWAKAQGHVRIWSSPSESFMGSTSCLQYFATMDARMPRTWDTLCENPCALAVECVKGQTSRNCLFACGRFVWHRTQSCEM